MRTEEPTPRCCANCYHYGYFVGYEELICEHTGKHKRRPFNYTNCKKFGFLDPIADAKVNEKGERIGFNDGCWV